SSSSSSTSSSGRAAGRGSVEQRWAAVAAGRRRQGNGKGQGAEMFGIKVAGLTVVVASSLVALSEAACQNNCNGHGTCGAYDQCSCYAEFDYSNAEDCSLRVCPYGVSSGSASGSSAHPYAECSDNGICNRKSGECECNDGFTGAACDRSACENDCNGRGQCLLLNRVQTYTTEWDTDTVQVCKCDPGFSGPACEDRMCPKGDDPLTLQYDAVNVAHGQKDEIQKIRIDSDGGAMSGEITLKFTDWMGKVHETRPLTIGSALTALEIQEALVALPNNVIPSVTVTLETGGSDTTHYEYMVTFSASENSGTQPLLEIDASDKSAVGNQPVKAAAVNLEYGTGLTEVTRHQTGTEESKVCSGRGICDTETGICSCFTGFYGHSCDRQTSLA
ncbi:Tenascin (TN) (Cytotactin) (GMEM) (GP 150-225) (Glioma-associated-extracellular matrix antigen) (Hexabrachion) (JI) (Myotendinous antigen) (Neuronectin) (Tenascin-C) (TN-C), partial [Durusdinium trenchii]